MRNVEIRAGNGSPGEGNDARDRSLHDSPGFDVQNVKFASSIAALIDAEGEIVAAVANMLEQKFDMTVASAPRIEVENGLHRLRSVGRAAQMEGMLAAEVLPLVLEISPFPKGRGGMAARAATGDFLFDSQPQRAQRCHRHAGPAAFGAQEGCKLGSRFRLSPAVCVISIWHAEGLLRRGVPESDFAARTKPCPPFFLRRPLMASALAAHSTSHRCRQRCY